MMSSPLQPLRSIHLPRHCYTPTIFMDESGSKGSGGTFFVIAALKVDDAGIFLRDIEALRQESGFRKEFKFGDVTKNSLPIYEGLADLIAESARTIGAFVVDKRHSDPFATMMPQWQAHNWMAAAVVKAIVTRKELTTVLADSISTPCGVSYGSELQERINASFHCTRIANALSLDSKTCDGLQAADLVASAIAHERTALQTLTRDEFAGRCTPKSRLAHYIAMRLGRHNFDDGTSPEVKIRTVDSLPNIKTTATSLVRYNNSSPKP